MIFEASKRIFFRTFAAAAPRRFVQNQGRGDPGGFQKEIALRLIPIEGGSIIEGAPLIELTR
jgi:hypothetical protein